MTKPDGGASTPSWGTWEELILAYAVNRHGTASWESIASELQKRTSLPNLSLTANTCRSKYLDLKHRFVVPPNHDSDVKSGLDSASPLLEELRRLRVAELRRQVQRYDLNIESLEFKVKRMEEERENSLREKSASDLEYRSEEGIRDVDTAAQPDVGQPIAGDGIGKDQLSVNESNSTDPEAEKSKPGGKESEPAETWAGEVDKDQIEQTHQKPVELKFEPNRKTDSCNGSSNIIEKSDQKAKNEPVTDSAESDGGEDAAGKDNSDVQSTASRSSDEKGGDKVRRGNTSGDEREHAENQQFHAQSQPLFDFLQAIRSHKLGSIFQRRLHSQETSRYHKLILQHVDLDTVERKLRQGCYSALHAKFFRDLLLLANNALAFFPKKSPESDAARVIRTLVSKEISLKIPRPKFNSDSPPEKNEPPTNPSNSSLVLKPSHPGSLVVCRKRSSIPIPSKACNTKRYQTLLSPASDSDSKEVKITKKRSRENRFSSTIPPAVKSGKNSSSSNNNSTSNNNRSNNDGSCTKQQEKGGGGPSSEEKNVDGKNTTSGPESKKRGGGGGNLSNRTMKRRTLVSNNGNLVDALKSTPLASEGRGDKRGGGGGSSTENRSNESVGRGEKKDEAVRRSTAEARVVVGKGKESPGKRNVGRPPKRGVAAPPLPPPPPPPPGASGKRGRERRENEIPSPEKQTKKRMRKL